MGIVTYNNQVLSTANRIFKTAAGGGGVTSITAGDGLAGGHNNR